MMPRGGDARQTTPPDETRDKKAVNARDVLAAIGATAALNSRLPIRKIGCTIKTMLSDAADRLVTSLVAEDDDVIAEDDEDDALD
jgi:hypothetical protein